MEIKRGSFATSLNALQKELGLSKQQVRTALKHLISTHELTQVTYPKFSIISIVNYKLYQQVNTVINNQPTQEQHTSNTGATPIEEYKNNRHIDNSVCNARTRENFNCQLGKKFKEYACKDCMKKYICPIEDDPSFKMIFGKTFYQQMEHEEKIRKERAEEGLSNIPNINEEHVDELNDYDWINDDSEE